MHLKLAAWDKGVHPWTTYKKLLEHIALDLNATASTRHRGVALAQGDMRRFIAVCSAVRESRCVGKFVVRAASTVWPRAEWLRRLAWGCTCGGGNRADLSLTITIETLTEDDVDVLRRVFAGGSPCGPQAPTLQWVVTTCDTNATCIDETSVDTTNVPEGTRLVVVGNPSATGDVSVLVPGFGMASVARSDVREYFLPAALPQSCVTSLTLSLTSERPSCVGGAVALVQRLGGSLTSLRIVLDKLELEQDNVVKILDACPRLERLTLSGTLLRDLEFLVTFCSRPTSTLIELILNDLRVTRSTGADTFIAALSTPSSRLAYQLRVLALGFTNSATLDASVVDAVFDMLEKNNRLQDVQSRPTDCAPGLSPAPGPKLALLISLQTISSAASKRLALDHLALSTVFAFASESSRRRSVNVSFG